MRTTVPRLRTTMRLLNRRTRRPRLLAALLLWWLLLGVAAPIAATASQANVVSFNVRYGTAKDGDNRWELRREQVFEFLQSQDFDFIGLQEALPFQVEEIAEALGDYSVLSRTREADPERGESCAILFRSERWQLDRRDHGTFWLSETPNEPGSKSWDSSLPRIATWGRFVHREDHAQIVVFNTHFDHRGEQARVESARLLHERAHSMTPALPVVVLGDFNAGESSEPMAALRARSSAGFVLEDSFRRRHPSRTDVFTFNAWGQRSEGEKIDSVFVSHLLEVEAAEIERPRGSDGRAPSDHDPVTARLRWATENHALEVVDLGECRSCAGGLIRASAKIPGVLAAELHETKPELRLVVTRGAELEHSAFEGLVRSAGYTPGSWSRGQD